MSESSEKLITILEPIPGSKLPRYWTAIVGSVEFVGETEDEVREEALQYIRRDPLVADWLKGYEAADNLRYKDERNDARRERDKMHARLKAAEERLAEMQELGVQLCQLLDGWKVDTAWTEWDESLRQRLSAWVAKGDTKG